MYRYLTLALAIIGVSGCASSERLMDAGVRPADRAECLVGNDEIDVERKASTRSSRHQRCHPEQSLKWSSERSGDKPMEVDFRKK